MIFTAATVVPRRTMTPGMCARSSIRRQLMSVWRPSPAPWLCRSHQGYFCDGGQVSKVGQEASLQNAQGFMSHGSSHYQIPSTPSSHTQATDLRPPNAHEWASRPSS